VSWKFGANWEVAPHKLLYATISKGYKNGVFITTGATFAAQLAPATQESVLAYETGFKLSLLNRTLQLNGAAFYYDYQNKQIRGRIIDPVLGGLNRLINIPKSRIAGAELQLVWEPVKGLTFNGGATYIGSKILGDFTNYTPTGTALLMSGEASVNPKWQLTGDIGYDHPISSTFNAFAGVSATYQSSTIRLWARKASSMSAPIRWSICARGFIPLTTSGASRPLSVIWATAITGPMFPMPDLT
jgi:outer membrane receptor protein involved in Fe transport